MMRTGSKITARTRSLSALFAITLAGCGDECIYGGKIQPSGGTFAAQDGCNTCSCSNGEVACTERACAPQWWKSCGDPVCSGHRADPNIAPCTVEKPGDACAMIGKACDPNDSCNAHLVCATSDPTKQTGGCPISRARWKTGIEYLDDAGLERYRRDLLGLKLATWRYRHAPSVAAPQLGFIIDDVGAGPEVNSDGETVNLYGYTSMAVAALQLQAGEIARLRAQVAELEVRMSGLAAARPVRGRALAHRPR